MLIKNLCYETYSQLIQSIVFSLMYIIVYNTE